MRWHYHRIWILAVLALSGIALAWLISTTPLPPAVVTPEPVATTTPDLSGRAIYASGEHGFSISYPETALLEETFSPTYHLASSWRANAFAGAQGTPIVAIIAYSTESDSSYPRYYNAQVRIGKSADAKEVANCLKPTTEQGEVALEDATIGGVVWKAFSFQNAGMQQYARGVSYRTLHEGSCFALEKIAAGSSYRDDPDSPEDIADEALEARYKGLDSIVETFSFAR
ncbi:MAG: hypothetical protein AAB892_01385 [Patescibacteria group bacterium]